MYVDAIYDKKKGKIRVVERVNGERVIKDFDPDLHFFMDHAAGECKSIFGNPVKKIIPQTADDRFKLMNQARGRLWEFKVNPIFRVFETYYRNSKTPELHVAFFDIEVDFDVDRGYSTPDNPFNQVTAISIYFQWLERMVCLSIPPKTITWEQAEQMASEVGDVVLFKTEAEMLSTFLELIEDADVLSGWNSGLYDLPYLVNRMGKILGKNAANLFNVFDERPKSKEISYGGRISKTYELFGRVHLDYLDLYKKYTFEERPSYKLNSIAAEELGETKVDYDGTLDELYNCDYQKFLEYNIQDTRLLDKLDVKLQYIELCNLIAHGNCVLLPNTLGTVIMTDQAITMEAHDRGMVVPDRENYDTSDSESSFEDRAAGGWVANPKQGVHRDVAATDMNSLYPSTIRAFNMSPETIVAQVDLSDTNRDIERFTSLKKANSFAAWWNDRFCPPEMDNFFNDNNVVQLVLKFEEDGTEYKITGSELRGLIFDSGNPWCISANGTIFRTDIIGVIPGLLTRWYSERKQLQGVKQEFADINNGYKFKSECLSQIEIQGQISDMTFDDILQFRINKLSKVLESRDEVQISEFLTKFNLQIVDDKIKPNSKYKKMWSDAEKYWDKRQTVKKLSLNATYGALLNAGSRFFDQRLGQSTTLTGRNITRHMAAKTNELITGIYDYQGDAIVYGDTDSTYFTAYNSLRPDIEKGLIAWDRDTIINLYNVIGEQVSDTFPDFVKDNFNVPLSFSKGVLKSSREIVADTTLFIKKKRYAAMVYDKDGKRKDVDGKPGVIKAVGLDLKRSDTPKVVQEFLTGVLMMVLTRRSESDVIEFIKDFKAKFKEKKPWEKGVPKAVNKLTYYRDKEREYLDKKMAGELVTFSMPGHVKASLNWNLMVEMYKDKHTPKITDGQKIMVCKLNENPLSMSSIAYPVDLNTLPDWFLALPFDDDSMLGANVDKKIENLLGVLDWDLSKTDDSVSHFDSLFG